MLDESGHDTSGSLNTEGKWGNVEEEKILSLLRGGKWGNVEEKKILSLLRRVTGKDSSLDSSTIGNSLIQVDALVGLLAVKVV